MLSLKTLHASGMTALLVAASGTTALAADMIGHAPPPPPPLTAAPLASADTGFYLRGDLGYGYNTNSDIVFLPLDPAGERTTSRSLKNSAVISVGAGYQVNSWLRGDITGEYRTKASFHFVDRVENTTTPANYYLNDVRGRISAGVVLANAYVDLGTWNRLTPYVGVGVGGAAIHMTKTRDRGIGPGNPGAYGYGNTATDFNFAWALHAGLAYDLGANWKVDLGYRYLNMGNANGGNMNCYNPAIPGYKVCGWRTVVKDYGAHDIRLGVRYTFADAAPAPVFAQGPLVRKY